MCFVISIFPFKLYELLDFADVGRVDDDVAPVHPDNVAVMHPPIPLASNDELILVQEVAQLPARRGEVVDRDLMHEVSLR